MKNKICILNIIAFLFFSGCSADLLDTASKGNKDPEVTSPAVKSFLVERALIIEWGKDEYCDEYIVYKDTSPAGSFNNILFRGVRTNITDIKLNDDTFYYYRLAKRLGSREFPKSDYIAGVSAFSRQDEYEDNDTKETAKPLDAATNGNIYYYNDNNGNEFEDTDWYYVRLTPAGTDHAAVRLIINEYSANIEADDIQYNIEGDEPKPLYQGQPFNITNGKNIAVDVYFQISVNKKKTVNPFVNKMGNYKLSIVYYE